MKRLGLILISTVLVLPVLAVAANPQGKAIYDKACQTCHNPNTAPLMKAPTVHDVKAWKVRVEQAKAVLKSNAQAKDALGVLTESVKNGKGTMPPGGMCNDCSDKDYRAAIDYMRHKG